jgi:hypothetical protein
MLRVKGPRTYPGEDHHHIIVAEGLDQEPASVHPKKENEHGETAGVQKDVELANTSFACLSPLPWLLIGGW